jgi:hypothetical protein
MGINLGRKNLSPANGEALACLGAKHFFTFEIVATFEIEIGQSRRFPEGAGGKKSFVCIKE